jgi:hypothetical protein
VRSRGGRPSGGPEEGYPRNRRTSTGRRWAEKDPKPFLFGEENILYQRADVTRTVKCFALAAATRALSGLKAYLHPSLQAALPSNGAAVSL